MDPPVTTKPLKGVLSYLHELWVNWRFGRSKLEWPGNKLWPSSVAISSTWRTFCVATWPRYRRPVDGGPGPCQLTWPLQGLCRDYPSAYANIESVHDWVVLTVGVTPLSSLIKINTSAFLTWPNPWPGSQGKKKSGHLHSHITIKITQSRIFQGVFRKLCETTGLTLVKKPLELCTCVIVPPTLVVVFECLLSSAEERRRSRFWKQNCVCMRVYNKSLTLLLLVVVVLHALRIYWAQALPSHHPMPNVAAALLYFTRHQAGGGQGGQAPPGIIENKCLFNNHKFNVCVRCFASGVLDLG